MNRCGEFITVQHPRAVSVLLCKKSSETDQTTSAFLQHLSSKFIDQDLLELRNCLRSPDHDAGLVSWLVPLLELVETLDLTLVLLENLTLGWHAAVHSDMGAVAARGRVLRLVVVLGCHQWVALRRESRPHDRFRLVAW